MDREYLKLREVREAILGTPDDTWLFERMAEERVESACRHLVGAITDERRRVTRSKAATAFRQLGGLLTKVEAENRADAEAQDASVRNGKVEAFVGAALEAFDRLRAPDA